MAAPSATPSTEDLHYLFTDLETTGLDENNGFLAEVAVIGTTVDLEELFRYSQVVFTPPQGIEQIESIPIVREMHAQNGLLDELREGIKAYNSGAPTLPLASEVDAEVDALIDTHLPDGQKTVILAGSGVSHFDHRWFGRHLPRVKNRLGRNFGDPHVYRTLDVGTYRIQYKKWVGVDLVDANDRKNHRALRDAELHLEEARAFRQFFLAHAPVKEPV